MTRTLVTLPLLGLLAVLLPACFTGHTAADKEAPRLMSPSLALSLGDTREEWRHQGPMNTEEYDHIVENPFLAATEHPLSTFSIDVDTASYSNVRRFLTDGTRPPPDAVRIEEMINYFDYAYSQPEGRDIPFSVTTEIAECPWNDAHRLVHIGVKAREIEDENLPPRNLVFLLDVSGSMNSDRKLPLVKKAMKLLAEKLTERDTVAIVVYAGSSGLVLPTTEGNDAQAILDAIDRLHAGGSTNGGEGIQLAYRTARENFITGGINRVILCTDGDFNVGVTNRGDLNRLIEKEREHGVFLTVLGFGAGNIKDSTMEALADRGNGNYAYIDSVTEAKKVLVHEAGGTLITVAKDVKIQVEWNPRLVGAWRLIGYENRLLAAEDFSDDKKDAGEIGAGHTVTALYEITSPRHMPGTGEVDPLRYQTGRDKTAAAETSELLTLKVRYKEPAGSTSRLLTTRIPDPGEVPAGSASESFRFSASVAAFGLLLRDSEYKGSASYAQVKKHATAALGEDPHGYRAEFLRLVSLAADL